MLVLAVYTRNCEAAALTRRPSACELKAERIAFEARKPPTTRNGRVCDLI